MDKQQMLAKIKEVIGEVEITRHGNCTNPVMIGDVLDWRDKQGNLRLTNRLENPPCSLGTESILKLWLQKRKPIDDQSDECIKFVYDLLPKE